MLPDRYVKLSVRTAVLLLFLVVQSRPLLANVFPFREVNRGDPIPDVALEQVAGRGNHLNLEQLSGTPFLVVFWGADLPEKLEHSARLLADLETLTPFLANRGVRTLSVNVQGDSPEIISRVVKSAGSSMEVFQDNDHEAYSRLGIFVMPSLLLVDRRGHIVEGLGYSHDLVERVRGAVEILFGEKTPLQVAEDLRPHQQELTIAQRTGRRYFDFGMVMLRRGRFATALREFGKAIEADPELDRAYMQRGCLLAERNELSEAERALDRALELDPDMMEGKVCRGELLRKMGKPGLALDQLNAVIAAEPDNFRALYYLGRVHSDLKRPGEAMEMYKKAYRGIVQHLVRDD